MEYTRTIEVGKARIGVVFKSLPIRLQSRLDDMTSQLFFEQGGRRTGTNLELGRIKDFVIYNAVAPDKKGQRKVRFEHPDYNGGEKNIITFGDPFTLDNFPEIDTDTDYMSELDISFMREILRLFPWLQRRYAMLFRGILPDAEVQAQAEEDPTESDGGAEVREEDGSTEELVSTGAPSNRL